MRKTRAVLLPFCGDPLLLRVWLTAFDLWKEEIDALYVVINATLPIEVGVDILRLLETHNSGKLHFKFINNPIDHGPALTLMLEDCKEDLVLLMEEDAFIFKPHRVDACFQMIEEGICDIVASPRGSCPEELWARENHIWPDTPVQQPNFWPNFFFISREHLLRTNRHFAAKAWKRGEYIEEIAHRVQAAVLPSDTFVWASIQLRGMGLRAHLTEQYHSRVEDIQDKDHIAGIFDRKASWVHIGSLSGWQHVLFDPLQPRIGEIEEHERRAGAWLMFWEDAQKNVSESMQEFSKHYKAGIDRLITAYTLSPARVKLRADLFRYLINPELYVKRQAALNTL